MVEELTKSSLEKVKKCTEIFILAHFLLIVMTKKMIMTKEEKQLLIKDLCARVPYVTFVYVDWHETEELEICDGSENEEESNIHTLISCNCYGECVLDDNLYKTVYDIKLYLRPLSSMTEEEEKEFWRVVDNYGSDSNAFDGFELGDDIDWLLEHHFDYRGLIEKGLALEAPEGMYNKN